MGAVLANIAANVGGEDAPVLMAGTGKADTHLLLVCSSERGLCGGFNSQIARLARDHARALMQQGKTVKIITVGKKGADIEKLKKHIGTLANAEAAINIVEVRKPELDAKLVAEGIAQQIERRVSFRRAMKRGMQTALRMGALGIRVNASGRLSGAEIARMEWYREGRVPLHTLRSDIDYGVATAQTTYGAIGIKIWIYKGEIKEHDPMIHDKRASVV